MADKHTSLISTVFFCPWAEGLLQDWTCLPVLLFYQKMIFTSPDSRSRHVWWFSDQFLMQYHTLRAVCQLPFVLYKLYNYKNLFEVSVVLFLFFQLTHETVHFILLMWKWHFCCWSWWEWWFHCFACVAISLLRITGCSLCNSRHTERNSRWGKKSQCLCF